MGDASEKTFGVFRFIDPDLSIPAHERSIYAGPAPKAVKEETIELHDLRTSKDVAQGREGLDTQAFTWVKNAFSLSAEEMLEGENVENIYIPEVKDLILRLTGASRVVAHQAAFRRTLATKQEDLYVVHRAGSEFDEATLKLPRDRFSVGGRDEGTGSEPARHAHCDMIVDSLYDTLAECRQDISEAGEATLKAHGARQNGAVVKIPRACAFSVWRPIKPVKRDPLAVLDYRSIDKSELEITDFRVPGQFSKEGTYVARAWIHMPPKNPEKMRWYWLPEQKPDEVLIVKFCDTASPDDPNIAAGCIHCSPIIPGTENEEERESIETRVYAFWD